MILQRMEQSFLSCHKYLVFAINTELAVEFVSDALK